MKELQRPRDGQGGLWYRAGRSPSQSCEELSVRSGQAEQSKSDGGGGGDWGSSKVQLCEPSPRGSLV